MSLQTAESPTSAPSAAIAALLMATAAGLNAADAVIVRMLSDSVHPFVIGFFRSLFGLMVVAPWILTHRGILASNYRFMHVLRAGLKLLALVAFFMAFAAAPLADATAIAFMGPIFLTIGAALFLGERLGPRRIFAVLAGFAGALIIIQPGASGALTPALLLALAGAALTAVVQLMLKSMAARDNTDTLVAWNLILIVPLAAVPAAFFWTTPDMTALALLAAQGILGALNMTLITRALSMADASFLAPLDFVRLPAVAVLSFVFFGEVAGFATWVGATVIFAATLLTSSGRPSFLSRIRLWTF